MKRSPSNLSTLPNRPRLTERLARACAARPRRTFTVWGVAGAVALVLVATSLHGLNSNTHVVGSTESTKASNALTKAFPSSTATTFDASDVVVISSTRYRVDESQYRAFVWRLVRAIRATGKTAHLRSYLSSHHAPVSADDHATLIQLLLRTDADAEPIESIVKQASGGAFAVALTGDHSVGHDFGTQSQKDLQSGELEFGLPAALIVLVLVFGAVVAGLVPVLLAILSIIVGLGIVALLSLEFSLSVFIVNMLTGMGLALGIDYSLFVISRYREERLFGLCEEDAIGLAGATASRAVLFSGSTFVIALFGMLLVPTTIMRSLAAGAIVVGVVSVLGALTLLPAVLGVFGDRVNYLKVPVVGRHIGRVEALESRFWRRIVDAVLLRPALYLALTVAAMLAAAIPIFGIHIGASGVATLPNSLPSKQGYLALQRAFPAHNPYSVYAVAVGGNASLPRDLARLKRELAADPRFGPGIVRTSTVTNEGVVTVPIRGDAVDPAAIAAVRDLRTDIIPSLFRGSGSNVYVGGKTAEEIDYFDAVNHSTPLVLAFVLALSFILLTMAFRSIVIALVSLALNLLSVGAAYGLMTLVFLYGYGHHLFGFQHVHQVDAWVPLFLFSVLFGLSMDYQVFLMSRIKEHYDQSSSTREAVASGVASTARIITSAAVIIVVVFVGFARGQLVMFQEMGFGVAVALLIDATIIRSIVLPSMLSLLGTRSWYLPRWLRWLPHAEVERAPDAATPVDATSA